MELSAAAKSVLESRYLLRNSQGACESPEQMLKRTAKFVASVDAKYGQDSKNSESAFFNAMDRQEFLPNSPCLMNAGAKNPQLSACFVLPIEDSIESIFTSLKNMAFIHQSGGGVGFSFSRLRPKGDFISGTGGVSSGPVSFMRVFDTAADVMKSGGRRRGANMGVLSSSHPDILEFVKAKSGGINSGFRNFNISVGASDEFMNAAEKGGSFALKNPHTGKSEKADAKKIMDSIAESAWSGGEPGMLFMDEINRQHTFDEPVESTNPCGEQPLLPYESCTLGSINLSEMLDGKKVDWEKLRKTAHLGVHFLDNAIDATMFPLPEIEKATLQNRKIGLGVMGFADMLIKRGIKYSSEEAVSAADELMSFISKEARLKSESLAKKRGSFPAFRKSRLAGKYSCMRNSTLTTIAPTGTISIIAGASSGIEPLFAVKYERDILGKKSVEENLLWKSGRFRKELFETASEIKPEQHVKVQAAFQKHTDNAVSKTVNMDAKASVSDVKNVFMLAWKLKCKGITVYRDKSRNSQVLNKCEAC